MSSRFVSSGAIDASSGESVKPEAVAAESTSTAAPPREQPRHKVEWEAVERELERERQKRAEARQAAGQEGEKSLYEALQANKAAKQAAFEEAHRLKNQFRPLDEDEVDFLEGIVASSRAEEDRVRKETQEGLDQFRQEQARLEGGAKGESQDSKAAEKDDLQDDISGLVDDADLGEGWAVGAANRKRKRREHETAKLIKRKTVTKEEGKKDDTKAEAAKQPETKTITKTSATTETVTSTATPTSTTTATSTAKKPPASGSKLALVDYGSDASDSD